jgi:hypothetical protein
MLLDLPDDLQPSAGRERCVWQASKRAAAARSAAHGHLQRAAAALLSLRAGPPGCSIAAPPPTLYFCLSVMRFDLLFLLFFGILSAERAGLGWVGRCGRLGGGCGVRLRSEVSSTAERAERRYIALVAGKLWHPLMKFKRDGLEGKGAFNTPNQYTSAQCHPLPRPAVPAPPAPPGRPIHRAAANT